VKNGVCGVSFDRKDIALNKLMISTLEAKIRVYGSFSFPIFPQLFLISPK
jgi:hypothetical protein